MPASSRRGGHQANMIERARLWLLLHSSGTASARQCSYNARTPAFTMNPQAPHPVSGAAGRLLVDCTWYPQWYSWKVPLPVLDRPPSPAMTQAAARALQGLLKQQAPETQSHREAELPQGRLPSHAALGAPHRPRQGRAPAPSAGLHQPGASCHPQRRRLPHALAAVRRLPPSLSDLVWLQASAAPRWWQAAPPRAWGPP
mmetsp:Transcript_18271/g.57253  ORF Transcript_18271/g.57253 Transcript_18271/m.57253 type:complete len:200 (-) Transcript_18271:779-1378(-)